MEAVCARSSGAPRVHAPLEASPHDHDRPHGRVRRVDDREEQATARHEGLQIRATKVLGLEHAFLEVLDKRLREETGLPLAMAEDPLSSVVLGAGKMLSDFNLLRKISID